MPYKECPIRKAPSRRGYSPGTSFLRRQQVVTNALQASVGYALAKEVVVYRKAAPKDYRLEQTADLMCTIELTALKFKAGESTETDRKMSGDWRSFKQNYLKILRRKLAA